VGPYKYVNGSALLGYLDEWCGYKEDSKLKYNVSAVVESELNQLLANITDTDFIVGLRNQVLVSCSTSTKKANSCNARKRPCLFNIQKDPCERNNIYDSHRHIVADMEKKLNRYRKTMVPPGNQSVERLADPVLYNNTWTCWHDLDHQSL